MPNYNLFVDPKTKKCLFYKNSELQTADGLQTYPIIDGIPRFVEKKLFNSTKADIKKDNKEIQTGKTFSNKWKDKTMSGIGLRNDFEKKYLKELFLSMLGLNTLDELKNLLKKAERTLNGGCGTAWSEYLFNLNSKCERHCVDLSLSVEAAVKNTKNMPNITISQASILNLPYLEKTFDIVYSAGVVHHTPNPKKATQELGKRVKEGGVFGVYIYNIKPFIREFADKEIRKKTVTMSYKECLEFSEAMTLLGKSFKKCCNKPLIVEKEIPLLGIKTGKYDLQKFIYDHFVKCWYNPEVTLEYSDLVNLDWYHPAYASHHDKAEVFGWLKEIGFTNLKCIQPSGWEHSGFFISGIRLK
ncbi:MAG: class I SAM-dependent methyltransferase [Smithella sp.]|nr:class I SAM-dependent methyltransferase [Smithella sp.]